MRISGPVSAIIITLILTFGLLFGLGKFDKAPPPSYATVAFDGGYQKIGVISSERIYTKGSITFDGRTLSSGTFKELIEWAKDSAKDDERTLEEITWKPGVALDASAGIEWVASESNFKMNTDSLYLLSTAQEPIRLSDVIARLEQLERKAKSERVTNATQSLTYADNPNASFLISKLMNALGKLGNN